MTDCLPNTEQLELSEWRRCTWVLSLHVKSAVEVLIGLPMLLLDREVTIPVPESLAPALRAVS